MGKPLTGPKVLDYLSEHPNQNVTLRQISTATKLSARQIQTAMSSLRNRHGVPVTTVLRGNVWRYEPTVGEATEVPEKSPAVLADTGYVPRFPTEVVNASYAQAMRVPAEVVAEINKENDSPLYTIGVAKNGDLILENPVTGTMYRATEL